MKIQEKAISVLYLLDNLIVTGDVAGKVKFFDLGNCHTPTSALLSSEDNLTCLPVRLFNITDPGLHRNLRGGSCMQEELA